MELHDQTAAAHELVAVIVLDGLKARHAFAGKNGQIRVELLCAGAFVQCRVLDNGAAPANVQRGSGLKILGELIKALDGQFGQKFGTAGSTSILTFPYSIVRRWTVSCSAPAWGALALLWQIYSRRRSVQIHFRQCGHRCGGSRAKSSRMAWRTAGQSGGGGRP